MAAPRHERFKAADVCQLAQVQPYVLRTWESEFPDLGKQTPGGPRVYGKADLERVMRIRELVYGEGLTLAGARRRLEESEPTGGGSVDELVLVDANTRTRLVAIRHGLQSVMELLSRPLEPPALELSPSPAGARHTRRSKKSP